MKNSDRFLLFIYLLITICIFGVILVIPTGYITKEMVQGVFDSLFSINIWYYFIGAIVLILVALRLIISMLKGESENSLGVIKYTSEGELVISNETIKSLIMKTLEQVRGIKESKVWIKPGGDKINILVKTLIMPDINIPQTVKEIQEKTRQYIEIIAEIPVGEIKVVVVDLASSTKLRVQ